MKNGSGEKRRKAMADAFRRGLRQLYGTDENQGAGETLRAGRKKKVVRAASVLACIVAFTTTYALILPAVTLESQPVCGQEEHIHTDACYAYLDADGATVDPAVAVSLPVAGDSSTDAENAQMTLLSGSREGYYESNESNAITETAGISDDGRPESQIGDGSADMTGESGMASADASVSALSAAVDADSNPAAPLTDDISTEVTSAENTGSDGHSVTALPADQADDADSDASDSDDPDTTDIPMPDVTADAPETATTDPAAETTAVPVSDAAQSVRRVLICGQEEHQHSVECYPAKSDASTKKISPKSILTGLFGYDHSQSVTVDGTTITAEYKEGVLPDGVTMQAVPVPADAYVGAVADAVGKENTEIKSFDITFLSDGQEIEPSGEVKITFQADFITPDTDPAIVHITDDGSADLMDTKIANDTITLKTDSFSVYAISYTVDFHWEVDGKTYDFSMPGGGFVSFTDLVEVLGITGNDNNTSEYTENDRITDSENAGSEQLEDALALSDVEVSNTAKKFVDNVESITFSNPDLLWVGKVNESTTVGALKKAQTLDIQYSIALTEDQIVEIDNTSLSEGDWALISLMPFNTDEKLTITMKNGDLFEIQVTDHQEISSTAAFNSTDSFVIAYKDNNNKYHVLKADGTQQVLDSVNDIDYLDNNYKWKFYYVFEEKDEDAPNFGEQYYFIRPISDLSQSIALNDVGETLVQYGTNNIGILPKDGGFYLEGYANNNEDVPNLVFDGTDFKARMYENCLLQIFKQDDIKRYEFTVRSEDPDMGKVSGKDKDGNTKTAVDSFVTRSKNSKDDTYANNWKVEAVANTEVKNGKNRYLFDYFDINGVRVPDENVTVSNGGKTGMIKDGKLDIPYNGSVVTAHFKLNSEYVGPATVDDLSQWVEELKKKNVPLDESATKKTAEVYDYENRIYRVDLTTKPSLVSFNGIVDLGLILDVSGSMKFPSKLIPATEVSGEKNIWEINNETSQGSGKYKWQEWGMDKNKTYYVIAEKTTRATVFRLTYSTQDNSWHRIDASYSGIGDWIGAWNYNGQDYYTKFGADQKGTTYPIYVSGDNEADGTARTRSYYEKQSIDNTAKTLNEILGILNVAKEGDGTEKPSVQAAWNTFAYNVRSSEHNFVDLTSHDSLNIDYATQGGTRTDTAMMDALSFAWGDSHTKYAILITDGAPQYSSDKSKNPDYPGGTLESQTNTLISNIEDIKKTYEKRGIKLITVGLSMKDVERGNQLLYDIADTIDGERMFFSAESGDELESILLKIIKKIMEDCIVYGDVQDEIGEAFYIVDKDTGKPIKADQWITLDGKYLDKDAEANKNIPHGVVQSDGKTIKWDDQTFQPEGWNGTVYVKAKEDLLGGNALPTNSGMATFNAESYATKSNPTNKITLKADKSTEDHYTPHQERETPLVNVNELDFDQNKTEWTVYLGTSVDPAAELQKLYENIKVKEVVKEGRADDKNGDNLPEIGKTDAGDNLWYPLTENSIGDDREDQGSGNKEIFYLKDLIKKLTGSDQLNWDKLIRGESIDIDYHVYGINDGSNIKITLTKAIVDGEPGLTDQPHATAVVGDAVEKYTLTVLYSPDYSVLPKGQGGTSTRDFHTGTYGTIYQGHAAGTETSKNEHIINVIERKLRIEKVDESGNKITGSGEVATFSIYRKSETGSAVDGLPEGKYEKVADNLSTDPAYALTEEIAFRPIQNSDETATNRYSGKELTYQKYYVDNTEYYIVEEAAPKGYTKASQPTKVDFTITEIKTPVAMKVVEGQEEVVLYNWTQSASGNETARIVKITNKETPKTGTIQLEKKWMINDEDVTSQSDKHPDSITFDLYRLKHVHVWDTEHPVVDKPATTTESGISHYNCKHRHEGCTEVLSFTVPMLVCEFDDNWTVTQAATCVESGIETRYCTNHDPKHAETRVIQATGIHTWSNWTIGVDSTCEDKGYHVRTCSVCGAEEREYDIDPKGHHWGEVKEHAATCEEDGYYYQECDHRCGAILMGETIPALEHIWMKGKVLKEATETEDGIQEYYCDRDSSHSKTEPIPRIQTTVPVTYHLRSMYYGLTTVTVGDAWEEDGSLDAYIGGKIIVSFTRDGNDKKDEMYAYGEYRRIAGNPTAGSDGVSLISNEPNNEVIRHEYDAGNGQIGYWEETIPWQDYYLELDVVEENELTLYLQDPDNNHPTGGHINFTIYSIPPATNGVTSSSRQQTPASLSAASVQSSANPRRSLRFAPAKAPANTVIKVDGSSASPVTTGDTGYAALNTLIDKVGYTDGEGTHKYYIVEKVLSGATLESGWEATYEVDIADNDGNPYKYFFVETVPDSGWTTTYSGQDEGLRIGEKTTIINAKAAPTTTDFSFTKAWYGIDGQLMTTWPTNISVSLYNSGDTKVGDFILTSSGVTANGYTWTAIQNADGTYTFTVTGLPAKDGETPLTYYVTESKVSGYTDPSYGIKQTQMRSDEEVDVIVSKIGSSDSDKRAGDGEYVINRQEGGYELPSTGGSGTTLLTILGSILVTLSGTGLILWKRRRLIGIR